MASESATIDLVLINDQGDYMKRIGNTIIQDLQADLRLNVTKVGLRDVIKGKYPDKRWRRLLFLLDDVTHDGIVAFKTLKEKFASDVEQKGNALDRMNDLSYFVIVGKAIDASHRQIFDNNVVGISNMKNLHEWLPGFLGFICPRELPPPTVLNVHCPQGVQEGSSFQHSFTELETTLQRLKIFVVNLPGRSLINTDVVFVPNSTAREFNYFFEEVQKLSKYNRISHMLHVVIYDSNPIYDVISQLTWVSLYKPTEMVKLALRIYILKTAYQLPPGQTACTHRSSFCAIV